MKEPVLPDRMVEHAEFCRYATLLMRLVLGSLSDSSLTDGDMSMDRVRRAVIVARTRIQWDQEELLELIWRHLQSKGRLGLYLFLIFLKVFSNSPERWLMSKCLMHFGDLLLGTFKITLVVYS